MKKSSVVDAKFEINVSDMADALANSDADGQAEFFNIFFKALHMGCGTNWRYDNQKGFIADKLNEKTKEAIKFLAWEENEN